MKQERKFFYGWIVVIGCILITMTMVPPIMSLSNKYLIYVTEDLGVGRSAFTMVNTIVQGLGIFLSPLVAKRLAKGNMKRIQAICTVGFCVSYACYSFATSVIHMYVCAFFVGVFYLNATLMPVSMMVTNWFNKKRGLAMSLAMAGIGIGGTVFSPILTFLLENHGWRFAYRVMALIVFVIAMPTVLFILKKSPEEMGMKALGSDEAQQDSKTQKSSVSKTLILTVGQSKGKLFFWLILTGVFCNGIINSGALGQFPPAIQELHGPALQATIISIYSLVGIAGKLILGWINDHFGVVASSAYGCLLFGLAFVFMLLSTNNANMLYIMAIVFGLGNAIGTVSPPLVTAEVFGKDKYAEAYGIVNSISQVGLALGSLIVAAMYDVAGNYTMAWIVLIIVTIITFGGWAGAVILSRKYKN